MNFRRRLLTVAILSSFCSLPGVNAQQSSGPQVPAGDPQAKAAWRQIPIPPLPAFNPKKPKRIELSNGMVILLQEDHERRNYKTCKTTPSRARDFLFH